MAKVLTAVAMVVAIAAAIPSGGTSLLGAGLAVSASTASMVASAVGIAAGLVTSLTAKTPAVEGGQTEWQSDPNGPIPIVFGETLVSSSIIYRKTEGKKNKHQFLTSILSGCGPIEAILETRADGETITFDTAGQPLYGNWSNWLRQDTQLGACPEPAQLGAGMLWANAPGWTASSKLSGYAAVMNRFQFDGKDENSPPYTQISRMQWLIQAVKCYDPRKDSTYPGGSGPQRWNDQTTWGFSRNGWVQAITYALGWLQGPNQIRVGGVGMPVTSIDLPAFVEAANVADANGWTSDGRITTADDKWESLKALCQAGGGEPVRLGATLSCMVNTPRVPIGTITRNDLIGNASVKTTQTRRDRINGIIPKYRSVDHEYEQVPAGVVRSAAALAEDGGIERTKEITYAMVQCPAGETPDQAAQLAGYDIANAREAGPAVFPLKTRWLGYKAGDCLTIEDVPEFGYLRGKDVIVLRRQFDPDTAGVILTMREETPAKHSWALGLVGSAAPLTDRNAPITDEAPDTSDWTLTTRVDPLGGGVGGTIILMGGVTDTTAATVEVEYRESGTSAWVQSASLSTSVTQHEITGLDPAKSWDVAISYDKGPRLISYDLTFDYIAPAPTAVHVTADTSANPPIIRWQMPQITGWAYAVVYRGTSMDPAASVAVSAPEPGGLYEPKVYEDDVLGAGTYWWWIRIFDDADTLLSTSAPVTGTIV